MAQCSSFFFFFYRYPVFTHWFCTVHNFQDKNVYFDIRYPVPFWHHFPSFRPLTDCNMRAHDTGLVLFRHTMDMLWKKFQWIIPLYMKPISFQSKASVVFFSQHSRIYWFLPEETKCVFPTYWQKTKWISESHRTNPQELKCWSTFYVNYFLRYHLMMQHQPIVKRVNGTHEWAHRPYQPLSAP